MIMNAIVGGGGVQNRLEGRKWIGTLHLGTLQPLQQLNAPNSSRRRSPPACL